MIGRVIKSETEDANENHLYLINTDENNENGVYWLAVTLDDVKERVCLFEGAVVAVEGIPESSTLFNAYKIFTPKFNPPAPVSYHGRGHLSMLYASGPYTFKSSLSYKPLEVLI